MKILPTVSILLIVSLFLSSSGSIQAQAPSQFSDSAAIFRSMYEAINAGDLEASLAVISDNTVGIALPPPPDSTGYFIGREAYTGLNSYLIDNDAEFEFTEMQVMGNSITFRALLTEDLFRRAGVYPIEFTGSAVVHDGMLVSETWIMNERDSALLDAALREEDNKAVVQRYIEAWEQADLTALGEMIAADFVNHSSPLPSDREGMLAFAAEHRSQFPTGEYTNDYLVAEDNLVFVFGHYEGTHDGEPFMGIPASGAEASFDYSLLLRLENGKIAERWATADDVMGMLVPLGFELVPPGE